MSASSGIVFNGCMEVIPVADATLGCVGCKNSPDRGGMCKGVGTLQLRKIWLLLLRLMVSRPPHVCRRRKAALGQLWGKDRLFCTLHMVIFEYLCFVRLTLLHQSHSFHALPKISNQRQFFKHMLLEEDLYSLQSLLLSGITNTVPHTTPAALPRPVESAASLPARAEDLPFLLLFFICLKVAIVARKAAKCHVGGGSEF